MDIVLNAIFLMQYYKINIFHAATYFSKPFLNIN